MTTIHKPKIINALANEDNLVGKLFFSMLPVQILILAMGAVNSIVDGAMAGRYIDASTVGVIGLYYSMISVINALGAVLLGGTTVLCGRYMGRGDMEKTEGVFSLNLTLTLGVSAFLTLVSVLFPGPIATLLGANEDLKGDLMKYTLGFAVGIIPMMMAQQISSFLQMERQSLRGYIGIAGMVISNVALDVLLVAVLRLGVFGLAIATSLSNTIYFLILAPYYLTSKAQLKFGIKKILWSVTGRLVKIGIPGALLVFCLAIRGLAINRILLTYAGSDGLSAMSAFSMVSGIFIAFCLGNGSVVRMLVSVFVGEKDKGSIKEVVKTAMTKGLILSIVVAVIIFLISPILTSIFFPDKASNVYHLTHQLLIVYSFCVPLVLIAQVLTNYLQAMGHNLFVNIQSVFDGFFSMVIPALLLAPIMGAFGVWIANPIGIILTILLVPIYNIIYWKRMPANIDEAMFMGPDFGIPPERSLSIFVHNMEEVSETSEIVQNFCRDNNIDEKAGYYAALSLEEMAGNVITHGFGHDNKTHTLNIRVVSREDDIMLRIKDDCIPFDPRTYAELVTDENSFDNIGIRMTYKIADDVSYQNMFGLNALTIIIKEENLVEVDNNDYLLEKALKKMAPELHQIFRNTAFAVQNILSRFKILFPDYTDHSEFHSLTVIDSCNRLIGSNQIKKLNADEIYILLVAAYLHDVGMGISEKDYDEFKDILGEKEFIQEHPTANRADFVRDKHHEFSGLFIEKYGDVFEIPTPEHLFAIKQVARGHRKTDLMDEKEYPERFELPNGNTVNTPYLAALLRISDEIDVVATRNPLLLYDMDSLTNDSDNIKYNKMLYAITQMRMTRNAFVMSVEKVDQDTLKSLDEMRDKMQRTLDYCREVVEKRSDFVLTQKEVIMKFSEEE